MSTVHYKKLLKEGAPCQNVVTNAIDWATHLLAMSLPRHCFCLLRRLALVGIGLSMVQSSLMIGFWPGCRLKSRQLHGPIRAYRRYRRKHASSLHSVSNLAKGGMDERG